MNHESQNAHLPSASAQTVPGHPLAACIGSLCVGGPGLAKVTLNFRTLNEALAAHEFLLAQYLDPQ